MTTFRYAVIDLASAPSLRPAIPRLLSTVAEPLLARSMPLTLLSVGPWLVHLADAPEIATALPTLSSPWGYYLHAAIDIASLRQALRKFNLADLPGHPRPVLFRYWDPRVLRIFLDHCTPIQRARFLEWIDHIEFADGTLIKDKVA